MHREHWNDPDAYIVSRQRVRTSVRVTSLVVTGGLGAITCVLTGLLGGIGLALGLMVLLVCVVIVGVVQTSLEMSSKRIVYPNLCQKCGYNMKGLPTDVTKCPECGSVYNRDQLFRQHAQDRAAESPENG